MTRKPCCFNPKATSPRTWRSRSTSSRRIPGVCASRCKRTSSSEYRKRVILVTCAVGKELAFLRPQPHVELLVTGVGPVEAAAAVSRALAQSTYDLVVSAGIGGAFEGMAEIGEGVVVADEMLELDLETGAPIALPDGAAVVNRATSDLTL